MPIVKMPDGTQVRFPDEMPKEQIRDMILRKFPDAGNPAPQGDGEQPSPAFQDALAKIRAGAPGAVSEASQPGMAEMSDMTTGFQKAPQEDVDRNVRANLEATKIDNMQGNKGLMRRAAEATSANLPYFDEMYSGTVGGLARMARDGVGYGEAYKREQALAAAQKRKRGTAANLIGDIAGGAALGGTLAKGGLTLTGRQIPLLSKAAPRTASTLLASGEGAAYGGLYGAGNAEEGHRLEDAATGAAIGGLTGGLLQTGANAVAGRAAKRGIMPAPTTDELAAEGNALYQAANDAGVLLRPEAMNKAAGNITIKMKSFGFDKDLQPKTSILLRKVLEARNQTLTLPELENIRKVGTTITREAVDASDKKAASMIVDQIDEMIADASNFNAGSGNAIKALQAARQVWKRKLKSELLEKVFENADLDTSQYTQSGMSQTIVKNFKALAKNDKKMRVFSPEERDAIRQIVKGGPKEKILRLVARFAPRGPVSFGAGVLGGTAVGGPAGAVLLPAAGQMAAGAIDRNAVGAVRTLQEAVRRGSSLPKAQIGQRANPFIAGAERATEAGYQLLPKSR